MGTVAKRIIQSMVPFLWVHELTAGSPGTIAEIWRFDNLADGSGLKLIINDEDAASGDNTDITRGDGAIFRFPKFSLIMDETEADITPAGSGADATKKAEITVVTNEAPLPTTITSWTAFLAEIKAKKGKLLMFTLPTGFTYDSRETQQKADGYIYVLVKITSDIEQKLGPAPSQITIVGASNKCSLAGVTGAIIEAATYTAITWKGKAVTLSPPVLVAGDGATLIAGDAVFKDSATYV